MHDFISLDYLEDSGVPGAKTAEGYAEPCESSKMELFVKIVNC